MQDNKPLPGQNQSFMMHSAVVGEPLSRLCARSWRPLIDNTGQNDVRISPGPARLFRSRTSGRIDAKGAFHPEWEKDRYP
jgi:hypothetical protein